MKCPFCDVQLAPQVHAGIEVDRCTRCGGLWFDRDELAAYVEARGRVGAARTNIVCRSDGTVLRCPRCESETLERCDAGGVAARRCSGCGGVAIESKAVPTAARRASYTTGDAAGEVAILGASDLAEGAGSVIEAVIEFLSSALDFLP